MEPIDTFEHAGVIVEIVPDYDPGSSPQDNDNAGTIYSWTTNFVGDELISEPDLMIESEDWNEDSRWRAIDLSEYMRINYDAALTIPLRFSDYGSSGARIYETSDPEDANCAICFTNEEIEYEWSGHVDPYAVTMRESGEVREYGGARRYAKGRIEELDNWLQGNVYGIVIREDTREDPSYEDIENNTGEVLSSVWGFIGDLWGESGKYIREEARELAECAAEEVADERAEAFQWACRDVVTV